MLNIEIENFESIDSTNDQAVFQIEFKNLNSDKIIIARQQTNGHGSNGHRFISDSNVGLYFTYVHFYNKITELSFITQKAAVSVYDVFYNIFNIDLSIKWVNDLYLNNKKIAGILCKNLIKYNAVIVGIGINLFYNKNLDKSIYDIAGYIFKDTKDLIHKLENNTLLLKNSSQYKNVYNDFFDKLVCTSDESKIWLPNTLASNIVERLLYYISIEGLPAVYVEKNLVKGKKIYEDCVVEC